MQARITALLLRLLGWLPLGVARACGWLLGECCWRLDTREAQTTRINIAHCFPTLSEPLQRQLARDSLREWGRTVFEIPVVWQRSAAWIERRILRTRNPELLTEALQSRRGLILLSPHLGNWEVAGLEMARRTPMTIMYEPPKEPRLDALIRRVRAKAGAELVPTNARGVLGLVRALEAGGTVGVLPDQEPELNGGEFVPFFGVSALTMTLVHSLVQRTGARVLFCFALRVRGGFELVFLEPDAAIADADRKRSVDALSRGVERCVQEAPAQYQWEYKRFKKRPEGEPRLYPRNPRKGS